MQKVVINPSITMIGKLETMTSMEISIKFSSVNTSAPPRITALRNTQKNPHANAAIIVILLLPLINGEKR